MSAPSPSPPASSTAATGNRQGRRWTIKAVLRQDPELDSGPRLFDIVDSNPALPVNG
jgi:hypothetical protein